MFRFATAAAWIAITASVAAAESEAPAENTRPKVVVLVSVTSPAGTTTSFGSSGTDENPARAAIAKALVAKGFEVVSAAGQPVGRVSRGEEANAPVLADASAADIARQLGAGAAIIVGLEAKIEGVIRGTRQMGALAVGQARLLDVGEARILSDDKGEGAGFGGDGEAASRLALRFAIAELATSMTEAAASQWPAPLKTASNRMKIRITGARTWAPVSAVIRRLATTRGIDAVHPREVKGSSVTLAVETSLAEGKVIKAIRGTRLISGTLSARKDASSIGVRIKGD